MRRFDISNDKFLLFDGMGEFARYWEPRGNERAYRGKTLEFQANDSWLGGHGWKRAIDFLKNGNPAHVAASEEFMNKLDGLLPPPSARHAIIDDVTGAVPNVGAFLAGQPMNMRRKVKHENEAAPIAVVLNVGSSAVVSVDDVRRRGLAALALVRLVSSVRPVELWVGVSCEAYGKDKTANAYVRIDTAPLDLQRAAHFIADPSMSRLFFYHLCAKVIGGPSAIPWGRAMAGPSFEKIVANGWPHASDVVAMPVLYCEDASISNPVEWIRGKLSTLAPSELEDAA